MRPICEHIKRHIPDVVAEWENLVRQEPWFSLPANHRVNGLPDVIVGLVEASLCSPNDDRAHHQKIQAAVEHGMARRAQGIPDHLVLTEYHLLRQALWRYLLAAFEASDRVTQAIFRIDMAISVATNASMWGYHREEIEAVGKWESGLERIFSESPLLRVREE